MFLPSAGQAVTRQPVSAATCVSLCLCLCISHLCVWLFVSVVSARVCFVCLFSISAFLAPGTMGWALAACLCSCLASSLQHYWVDSWPPNCRTRPHWAAALMLSVDLSFFIAKLCIQQQRLGCEKNKQCYAIIGCGRRCFVNIRLDLLPNFLQGQIFSKPWGMGEETYDLEGGGGEGEMAFSDKIVRRGFIKKVYSIISVQVEKTNMCFVFALCS